MTRRRPKVLLVDDDASILEATAELLTLEGFETESAPNGQVALERIKENRPDLVLLDLMMPVMDGWTFARALREMPEGAGLPIVLVSAMRRLDESARELNANDYLAKPFDIDDLLRRIRRILGKRSTVRSAPPS